MCPKLDGDLAGTIRIEDGRVAAGAIAMSKSVSIGDAAHPYAAALEFGHMDHGVHVPAEPYFFTTLRVLKTKFKNRMNRAVKAAVGEAFGVDAGAGSAE